MSTPPPPYGPRGHLPDRAAKRARKIVLREQMGIGWPLAAVVAAVIVAVAGGAYVVSTGRPPSAPYRSVGALGEIEPAAAVVRDGLLLVRASGPVRAFDAPGGAVVWCATSGRIEAGDGRRVWAPDGRLVGGDGESLQPRPSTVFDGVVYVDPAGGPAPPPPDPLGERPTC